MAFGPALIRGEGRFSFMTVANYITLFRLALIPVFVVLALYYGESVRDGAPVEAWRYAAVAVFLTAAVSDGLDGWVARRFNQMSKLGGVLDPLADKCLVFAALITLSLIPWARDFHLPLWFPALVISKDALSAGGALLIRHVTGKVIIRPHWTGKVATVLLMTLLARMMLHLTWLPGPPLAAAATVFVVISGCLYISSMVRQLRAAERIP